MNLKHFSLNEFDSPDLPGSGNQMNFDFTSKLDLARETAGIPFSITSGFRTVDHNNDVGGVIDSAHLTGNAADIACMGSRQRYLIVSALQEAGFTRIGIANSFIHVDNDPNKPSNVIWTY